ncbi:MAG TPA: energy transducer TonB [Ramlibacter sp.]|jgi:protein TonB|nr:energy transducer TonB [Ramlibacter sp.]
MTQASLPSSPVSPSRRNLLIAGGVVLLHVGALYALQSGLLRRAVEVIVPVAVVTEMITPPAPQVEPPAQPRPQVPTQPQPQAQPQARAPEPRKAAPVPPAPRPLAAPSLPPVPSAPLGVTEPQPAPPPITAPVAVAPAPPAPAPAPPAPAPPVPAPPAPAPARVELPSSNAEHLQNPPPVYPPASRRLGEQGTVLLRVLIGPDGSVQDLQLKRSSGYDRLDRSAQDAVRKWRFVPGRLGGVPAAMWHDQPVGFDLQQQ